MAEITRTGECVSCNTQCLKPNCRKNETKKWNDGDDVVHVFKRDLRFIRDHTVDDDIREVASGYL